MVQGRMKRGADLPYKLLAGVEPCPGGWCVVTGKLQGITLFPQPPEVFKTFVEVLDYKPAFTAVALHVPVGMVHDPSKGERRCDVLARKLLGWPRASAVQSPPTRAALSAATYEEAREANGGHLNPVTWSRMRRIREAAGEMQPYWQRMVYEVNPELAFHQLNDGVTLRFPKTSAVGLKERRELLENKFQGVARILDTRVKGASERHIVDAVANLWIARRIASKAAQRLPEDPEWDDEGLRMEILH